MENKTKKGRNWKAKYLTIELFDKFVKNDYAHTAKRAIRSEAILWILTPLVIAILTLIIVLIAK